MGPQTEPAAPSALRPLAENTWRHRRTLLAGSGAILGAAILLGACLSPRFVSRSTLVLLIGPEYTVRLQAGAGSPPSTAFDPDHILGTETAILSSDDLARDVVREIGVARLYPALVEPPGLLRRIVRAIRDVPSTLGRLAGLSARRAPPDPLELAVAAFEDRLDIEPSKTANVISLGFTHRDPALARRTLAAFERTYLARRRALYRQQKTGAMRVELDAARAQLDRAERRLAAFRASRALPDYTTQLDILLHEQGDIAHDRDVATRAIAAGTARIAALRNELAHLPGTVVAGVDINFDGRVASLRDSLDGLHAREVETLAHYRPDSDVARAIADQIRSRTDQLRALEGVPGVSASHRARNPAADSVGADLLVAEGELRANQASLDSDRDAAAGLARRIAALDENQRLLDQLGIERDSALDATRSLAASLATQESVEAVEARALPSVRIATDPSLPLRPKPIALLLALAGAIVSAGAFATGALLLHALRRTLLFADDIEQAGVCVLATVPADDRLAGLPALAPLGA